MVSFNSPTPQTNPLGLPKETLPTMYDLPSEYPEERGKPDEFHDWQAQLLSLTFCPPHYPLSQIFYASDLNLYYDVRHPLWHKRPDWFGVVGVPRLYNGVDMRLSYVVWQEGVNPFVVVELLSPGTEKEDLGEQVTPGDRIPIIRRNLMKVTVGDPEILKCLEPERVRTYLQQHHWQEVRQLEDTASIWTRQDEIGCYSPYVASIMNPES